MNRFSSISVLPQDAPEALGCNKVATPPPRPEFKKDTHSSSALRGCGSGTMRLRKTDLGIKPYER